MRTVDKLLFIFTNFTMRQELIRDLTEDEVQNICDGELDVIKYENSNFWRYDTSGWVLA